MAQKRLLPLTFEIRQPGRAVRHETLVHEVLKVGRDQKSHLCLDDEGVARMHAVIEARPDDVQIIDLGSGTRVNGQLVSKATLASGDVIQMGNTEMVLEIGVARDAVSPLVAVGPLASATMGPFGAQGSPSLRATGPVEPGLEGEDVYQLIKRGSINAHEVEEVGGHAVEVTVLWKTSILHVAHLHDGSTFVLTSKEPKKAPTAALSGGLWGVGGALMIAGAAMSDPQHAERNTSLLVGGLGAATALVGSGVGIALHRKNEHAQDDVCRFVVSDDTLGAVGDMPTVVNAGGSRFVFLPGATGEVELQGVRRTLDELKAQGHARPSTVVAGAFEVNIQPEGRYRQEVGGITVVAKVVAPGRVVAGHLKRDPTLARTVVGSGLLATAAMALLHLASSDDAGFLSSASSDDRLAELRAFMQRQQERQPEPTPQPQQNDPQAGGTGTRHVGDEGKMGRRDAPQRSARYVIRNNGTPPQLSREAARQQVQNRGIFAALAAPGGAMAGGASGIVSPFGAMNESGTGDRNANGNMTGATEGDAFGYGGLGSANTGWGGGGTGEGTIGMGNIGTMGHGSGLGTGQSYGAGAGRGLRNRGNSGPRVSPSAPVVTGLLSPEAIRRVVLRNLGQVNHCYVQGLETSPNIAGRVVVRFVIGGTGSVMGSNVADNSIAMPSVGECISNAVRRWQFPAPDGGGVVTVNYPFNLQPADQ